MSIGIKFKNTRIEDELDDFEVIAKKLAKEYGYTANLDLDKKLAQLLRLRVSQKNECAYCKILHSSTARNVGINHAKVDNISSWWNSELFDEKEKAALQYCDILTEGTHKNFQKYHEDLEKYYTKKEIAEIAAVVINMNLWTRLKLAQGQIPY